MGRPKGSKNKPKEPEQLEITEVVKKKNSAKVDATEVLRATVDLAMVAGRSHIVNKVTQWATQIKYDELKVVQKDDMDIYELYLDGERVATKHIQHEDVMQIVAGVFGLSV